MEYGYIQAFVTVAHEKNFTRAAEKLNLTQSTVTTRIQSLEKHLRRKLFTRNSRRVELTNYGQTIYPYLKRILELMDECEVATRFDQLYETRLDIGVIDPLWSTHLAPGLAAFRSENSKVAIRLISGTSQEILDGVVDGVIDVGVVTSSRNHPDIEVLPLVTDPIVLVGRPGMHWTKSPVTTTDVIHANNVFADWGSPFTEWFHHECRVQHIPSIETSQHSVFMELLRHDYTGFVPRSVCRAELESGELIEIDYHPSVPVPERQLFVVRKKRTTKEPLIQTWLDKMIASISV